MRQYLGDGLYASYDGYMYILTAPMLEGEHYVALEPEVLMAFLKYVEKIANVTITVTKNTQGDNE